MRSRLACTVSRAETSRARMRRANSWAETNARSDIRRTLPERRRCCPDTTLACVRAPAATTDGAMGRSLLFPVAILLLTATMPHADAPFLNAVVEGYYGRPWTHEARRDVIRFLGAHGMSTFVYGPKNDPFHRDEWREPYPEPELAELGFTAREARKAGVRFVYALSPALDICYA